MQVLDRAGVGTLWSICKTKFALAGHTHNWSQISGAPATATRWPSWGEVTGKPELKSWSETKSYIDNKAASLCGVEQILNTTEVSLQDQFVDDGYSNRYTVGKFNSYKYIDRSTISCCKY